MPLYEYECEACGARFEHIQKFSDPPIEVCPNCGEKKVQKLLSSPAIQFKGSGWYITDYARKGKETDSGGKDSKESAESKKESKESGESKAESKTESKESKDPKESKEPKTKSPSSAPTTSSKDT